MPGRFMGWIRDTIKKKTFGELDGKASDMPAYLPYEKQKYSIATPPDAEWTYSSSAKKIAI